MELLELQVQQPEEATPLNAGDQSEPPSAEEPSPAQVPSAGGVLQNVLSGEDMGINSSLSSPRPLELTHSRRAPWDLRRPTCETKKEGLWSSCNRILIGNCRLWMAIASIFVGLIILIIISLCLIRVTYIDEDENEIPELSSNKTFLVMLKIPDECVTEEELSHLLTKRLTNVYNSSPLLSRYFMSVEIADISGENATITYHLLFGVPSGDERFMQYMMSDEVVLSILRQDFHDQNVPGCEALGLDPTSLFPYE
ncbi:TPA-induced transmembrane protein [Talpa occidentalis]|uniref:TPA-induced transmembrane protein n=1 Tax=Talpa occidentalis TaxID=50954 RepID=UPI00188E1C97|nr:TPA-induced transmembrane protein [Talpa occidentalis]